MRREVLAPCAGVSGQRNLGAKGALRDTPASAIGLAQPSSTSLSLFSESPQPTPASIAPSMSGPRRVVVAVMSVLDGGSRGARAGARGVYEFEWG